MTFKDPANDNQPETDEETDTTCTNQGRMLCALKKFNEKFACYMYMTHVGQYCNEVFSFNIFGTRFTQYGDITVESPKLVSLVFLLFVCPFVARGGGSGKGSDGEWCVLNWARCEESVEYQNG